MWIDEPPFAFELRRTYDALLEQARFQAGATRQRDIKPSNHDRNPPYTLVGGSLSAEQMRAVDHAFMDVLRARLVACHEAGQRREVRWLLERVRRWGQIYEVDFIAKRDELVTLAGRLEKAAAMDAEGRWPGGEEGRKREAGLVLILDRMRQLREDLHIFRPDLQPPPSQARFLDHGQGPVGDHFARVGGWAGLVAMFGEPAASAIADAFLAWATARGEAREQAQAAYKALWQATVASTKGSAA